MAAHGWRRTGFADLVPAWTCRGRGRGPGSDREPEEGPRGSAAGVEVRGSPAGRIVREPFHAVPYGPPGALPADCDVVPASEVMAS